MTGTGRGGERGRGAAREKCRCCLLVLGAAPFFFRWSSIACSTRRGAKSQNVEHAIRALPETDWRERKDDPLMSRGASPRGPRSRGGVVGVVLFSFCSGVIDANQHITPSVAVCTYRRTSPVSGRLPKAGAIAFCSIVSCIEMAACRSNWTLRRRNARSGHY